MTAHAGLRARVRDFVEDQLNRGTFVSSVDAWHVGFNPRFTTAMAEQGFIGMTWPRRYGGAQRHPVERFVVIEELLAAGAPMAAHWVSDRQAGPALLNYGTDAQKERFLPKIVRGELYFAIGMSEPDAGSDLAAVRTRAVPDGDGWRLSGSKIWTTHATRCHYMFVLCRTDENAERHAGLTQLMLDLSTPGVTMRPIRNIAGQEHFAEIFFDDVYVPGDMVIGTIGQGWTQVVSELALERSGPERFMSTIPLARAALADPRDAVSPAALGRLAGDLAALHHLSIGVAAKLAAGTAPGTEAALVKDLATTFEHDLTEWTRCNLSSSLPADLHRDAVLLSPGAKLRGGTNEILRTIVAKDLLRGDQESRVDPDEAAVRDALDSLLEQAGTDVGVTRRLRDEGWLSLGVDEALGGGGADAALDLVTLSHLAGHDVRGPYRAVWVAQRVLASLGHTLPSDGLLGYALGHEPARIRDGRLGGPLGIVPWADRLDGLVVPAVEEGRVRLALVHRDAVDLAPVSTVGAHDRFLVMADDAPVELLGDADEVRLLHASAGMAHAAVALGQLDALQRLVLAHITVRTQFGRPLSAFGGVHTLLVDVTTQHARCAAMVAGLARSARPSLAAVTAARLVAAEAATTACRAAHQAHGAIGFSEEFPLHHFTRELWAGRDEDDGEAAWAERLGREVPAGPHWWAAVTRLLDLPDAIDEAVTA